MQEIIKGEPVVIEALEKLCSGPGDIRHSTDNFGNSFNWFTLKSPDLIVRAAEILRTAHARLAIIAAFGGEKDMKRMHGACYEFVLAGVVYSITVNMDRDHPSVPSITSIFNNADWHEREMMELYDIDVVNHPNPRRLFLDETLDKGIIGEVVPLSIMMNGASSSDLWEILLAGKEAK